MTCPYLPRTWDRDGRLKTSIGPDQVLVAYDYDAAGRVQYVTRANRQTTYALDAAGNITSVTEPSGRITTTARDRLGRVVASTAGGETTTTAYDDDSLVLRETRDAGGRATTYDYDDAGRLTVVTDPDGRRVEHRYDPLGRETRTIFGDGTSETRTYDADRGAVATHTDRAGRTATMSFDPSGRVRARSIDDHGAVTAMAYELATPAGGSAAGIVQRSTFAGQVIDRRLDRSGRLVELTLPGQPAVALSYDLAGRATARAGTTSTYDPGTGQLVGLAAAGVGSAQFAYDSEGRVLTETLPNGVVRTWSYDPDGRIAGLTQTVGTLVETWTYTRDTAGRITRVDAPDHVDAYRYETGRLAREERTGASPRIVLYALDGAGNRTASAVYDAPLASVESFAATTLPASVLPSAGSWSLDQAQLLVSGTGSAQAGLALVGGGAHLGPDLTVSVQPALPAAGTELAGFAVPGAAGTRYRVGWQVRPYPTPDFGSPPAQGRLAIQRVEVDGTTDLAASAWIDELGTAARSITLTQWPDERLGVTGAGLDCAAACPGIGRLLADAGVGLEVASGDVGDGGGAVGARFDDLQWSTTTGRTGQGSTYDGFNRLTGHDEAGTAGTASESYAYDLVGNLTGRTRTGVGATTAAYEYDVLGRMTRATVGDVVSDYSYLGDSWMRATATTGGVVTGFAWDGRSLISRTVAGTTASYLTDAGRVLAEARGGGASTYGYDGLGSATGVIAAVAAPVAGIEYLQRYEYDAFGNVKERARAVGGSTVSYVETAAAEGPRYRGMWFDGGNTGLYKTQTRAYSPEMGRFTQLDPARAGSNWYAYCGGDPVNRSDPSGLDWVWTNPPGEWHWDGQFDGEPMTEEEALAEGLEKPPVGPHDVGYWGILGLPPDSDGTFRVGADISQVMNHAFETLDVPNALQKNTANYDRLRAFSAANPGKAAFVRDVYAYLDRRRSILLPPPDIGMTDPNYQPPIDESKLDEETRIEGAHQGMPSVTDSIAGNLLMMGATPQAVVADAFALAVGAGRLGGATARAGWRAGAGLVDAGLGVGRGFAEGWALARPTSVYLGGGLGDLAQLYDRAAGALRHAKNMGLPAARRMAVDIEHIASGHIKGGLRAGPAKDLFPEWMSKAQVERAVKAAYGTSKRVATQGVRVQLQGQADGLLIEMWVNLETKTIETAYPLRR